MLDALLADGVKVGMSPARIDPLGDYTMQFFNIAEKARPGMGQALRSRAVVLDNGAPPSPSGDYYLDALRDGRIGLAIVYCSGKGRYARLDPSAAEQGPLPKDLKTGLDEITAEWRAVDDDR